MYNIAYAAEIWTFLLHIKFSFELVNFQYRISFLFLFCLIVHFQAQWDSTNVS